MYSSFSFWGKLGSSLMASARFVSGPMATSETCVTCVFSLSLRKTASTSERQPSYLARVFSHQSDHCFDCMLVLEFALPLLIFLFDHIPESIGSKVVAGLIEVSEQGPTRASEHWNLQRKILSRDSFHSKVFESVKTFKSLKSLQLILQPCWRLTLINLM